MTRPHVEFIQAQALPWTRGIHGDARPDVEAKVLSRDADSGEASILLRYPGGWQRPGTEHLTVDEEIFVLDGAIEIDGVLYHEGCYAYLPGGYVRHSASVANGAVVLTFYSGDPHALSGEPETPFDETVATPFIDSVAMDWQTTGFDPNLAHMQAGRKLLWENDRTGEQTFLFCSTPHCHPDGWKGPQETHPVVEESYLISGDVAGHAGLRRAGAYYWRPPGIRHGPFGSLTGSVAIFRIRGGPLVNVWSEDEVPFTFKPEYKPTLPPELATYGAEEWRGTDRF